MAECPSDDDLRQLLSGAATATIGPHLSDCERCRARADRLSDDPLLRAWAAALATRPVDPHDRGEVSRLVQGLCASHPLDEAEEDSPPRRATPLGPPERSGDLGMLGPFAIEAEIGRGGMGVVYRARDVRAGRVVAIKVLHIDPSEDPSRSRFLREVRAAARVDHDHLVRLYTMSDPADAVPYFVMEWIDGPSLAEEIRTRQRIAPREAAGIVAEVAAGLHAAHSAGLVHRDVKPGNILIERATNRAKIGDFGLARISAEASAVTRDGVVPGTPAYISPEQVRGDAEAGPLADVYALGVTLYECLTGEPPFRGTPHRIAQQILHDEPRPPRSLNDAVARDLQTVCLKAMDKDPGRRYADAAEFADDLRRWLGNRPIRARPIGPAGRLGRWVRRHPRIAALSASLVAALLAGVVGIVWQWRRAEANGRRAREHLARSLESIDVYFTRVSENRLLDVPNLQPLRKELLAAARDFYEDILRDRPEDPAIRAELAGTRARLALVISAIGSYDEAIDLLRRSLSEYDAILAARPDEPAARNGLITALVNLAAIQMHGSKVDDCGKTLDRLLAMCAADRRSRPTAPEPLQGLYAAHHDRGSILSRNQAQAAAVAVEYESALEANRALLALKPDYPPYLRNTSRTAALLWVAYRTVGRQAEARTVFDEGYGAAKRLYAEHPDSLEYRFSLAPYEASRGELAMRESLGMTGPTALARLDEAVRGYAIALDLVRGLARENPQVHSYHIDLLGYLDAASIIESAAGRHSSAMGLIREAREVYAAIGHAENNYGFEKTVMAEILYQEAHEHAFAGNPGEAMKSLDAADRIVGSLTERERVARGGTAIQETALMTARAVILCEAGRVRESLPSWDRATEKAPPGLRPLIGVIRDLYLAGDGMAPAVPPSRVLAVVPVADAICTSTNLPPCAQIMYARLYATAASGAEEATRERLDTLAVLRLEKAGQSGYFCAPGRLGIIEADPALRRLKERRDYAAFRERAIASTDLPSPLSPPG